MAGGNVFERLYQTPTVASRMQKYEKVEEPKLPELHPERHHLFRSSTLYKPTVAFLRSTKHYQNEKERSESNGAQRAKSPRQSLLRTPLRPHEKLTPKPRLSRRPNNTNVRQTHYSQPTAQSKLRTPRRKPTTTQPSTPDTAASSPSPPRVSRRRVAPYEKVARKSPTSTAIKKESVTGIEGEAVVEEDPVVEEQPMRDELDDDLDDLLATEREDDDADIQVMTERLDALHQEGTEILANAPKEDVDDMRSYATLESIDTTEVGLLLDSQEDEELRILFDEICPRGESMSVHELEKWLETTKAPLSHKMVVSRAFCECRRKVTKETFPIFHQFLMYYSFLWAAFSQIDTNKDQRISREDFLSLSGRLSLEYSYMKEVYEEMDAASDGPGVGFDAFCDWSSMNYMQFDNF